MVPFVARQVDQIRVGGWPVLWRKLRLLGLMLPKLMLSLVTLPIGLVTIFVSKVVELLSGRPLVRFLNILYQHIGHLAVEPDLYVKEGLLGKTRPFYSIMVISPRAKISNQYLLNYIRQKITVITSSFAYVFFCQFICLRLLRYDVSHYAQIIGGNSSAGAIYKEWGDRPPLWSLTATHVARGQECLRQLGIPDGAWFVCVHCRDHGYCQLALHDFRNVNSDDYMLAMQAIVGHGGWCIRMGDSSMKPIEEQEGIVDYCHTDLKSDWMDIFLCASCKFFLGSSSGLIAVSHIFGIPAVTANAAPMCMVPTLRPGDISIPKLYWSNRERRMLTFSEVMGSPMSNFRYTSEFEEAGITLIENAPEDVRDLAIEMLEITEGSMQYTAVDELLQTKFLSLMRPDHYMYDSAARIGRDFLRKYRYLL